MRIPLKLEELFGKYGKRLAAIIGIPLVTCTTGSENKCRDQDSLEIPSSRIY